MGQAQGLNKFGCCEQSDPDRIPEPEPVTLNIYDLHGNGRGIIKGMNALLRAVGTGAFHVGLEVFGQEWSFGHRDSNETGVYSHAPRESELHSYRESVLMGETDLTQSEVVKIIKNMSLDWTGDKYDMLTRNCCHFCDELCMRLSVNRPSFVDMPEWVSSLAAAGAALAGVQDNEGSKENKLTALENKLTALESSPEDANGKSSRRKRLSATEDTPPTSSRAVRGRSTSRESKPNGGFSVSFEVKW